MAYNKRLFEMLADEIKEYNNNAGISTSDSHTAQDIISGKYQKEYEKLQEQQRQLQMQRQQEELQKNQVRAKQLAQETMEKQQSSSNTNQIGSTFRSIVNKSQSNSNDEQIDAKKISKRILDNDLYYKIRNPTLKGLGDAIQTVADGITKEAYSTIEDFTGFLDNISTGVLSGIKKSADYLWNAGQSNIKNSTYNILNEQQIEKAKQNGIIENDYDYYKEMIPEDSPIRMLSNEANNLKKQLNEKSKETDNFINNAINNNVEGASNPISKKLNELAPSIGQMIPGMVGGGTPYMFTSAAGSYYDDALDRGMDEDKALTYATIMGGIEGITESVQFGKIFKAGSNITTGSIKSALKEYGFNIADNFVQEAVTEPLSEITAQTVGGTADWSNMGSRMLKSGIDGAIVSIIVDASSAGISSAKNIEQKINNNENITKEELAQVIEDVQGSGKVNVEEILKQEIQSQISKNNFKDNQAQLDNINQTITGENTELVQNLQEFNIDNNNEIPYNMGEMESDIDGQIQAGGMARVSEQYGTRLQQESEQQKSRQYTRREYEQWERSIIPTEETNLDNKQREIKNYVKRQYGKDIVFFDSESDFNAGASLTDSNKIYVNLKEAEDFGVNNVIYHEIAESNILHNKAISNDIIQPAIEKIINDNNFEQQKQEFWKNQKDNMPSDYAIAKDILCDRFAELHSGERVDYNNVLSKDTNMTLDYVLNVFDNKLNSKNLIPHEILSNTNKKSVQDSDKTIIEQLIDENIEQKTDVKKSEDAISIRKETDKIPIIDEYERADGLEPKRQKTYIEKIRDSAQEVEEVLSDIGAIRQASNDIDKQQNGTEQNNNRVLNKLSNQNDTIADTIDKISMKRGKEKTSFKAIKDSLAQSLINKAHYIDKLANKTGNKELTYKYDRYLGSLSEAQYSIGKAQTDNDGKVIGKSVTEIFKPAIKKKLYKEFNDYLFNRHNIDRMAVDKAIYGKEFTAENSKRIINEYEKRYPQFKDWANDVYQYNKNALRNKMEAGFISKETYNNFLNMYGNYVPTYRDIITGTEGRAESEFGNEKKTGFSPIKEAKGGKQQLLAVDEAMAEQVVSEKRALRLNETLKELYHTLGEKTKTGPSVQIDNPIATSLWTSNPENFISIDDKGSATAIFFENGEVTQFEITPEIYKAFENNKIDEMIKNGIASKSVAKVLEQITSFRRDLLTTYSIGFSFNNPIKDIQEAVFNTKFSVPTFAINYTRALLEIPTKGDYYKLYLQNGGGANTYFEHGSGLKKQNKFVKTITTPIRAINQLNEILERAPRLAEFISTMQKTGNINEAMYNSAEITTNFKRGGDITKVANRYGANFLNAGVQGLDKMYRNLTGQNGWKGYATLITRATVLGIAPALLNHLVYRDDDDYKDLPDYIKESYWLFKKGDGKFFRIPQGRVISALGTGARNILEVVDGEKNAKEGFVDFIKNAVTQFAPSNPIENNIFSPIFQVKNNKSWYGEDIVSSRLSKLPNAEQYDERTDDFSKWLGEKLNVSPKKINYLLDQYGGGISDILLPMGTPYAENSILEEKFTTDSVMKNKNVSLFYDTLEDLEKNKNSKYATDTDELKYKYMSSVNKDVADLYSQKRDIENSDMTDEEKKEAARAVQKKINSTVKDALLNYKNVGQQSNYTSVGETEYYKNSKGKWEEIDDTKVAELSQLKLTDEQKNDYFKVKEATDKIDKKYKTSDLISDEQRKQYSNSKRIEIANKIISSNLDDNSKAHLYNSYYSSDKDIQTVVDLGIDVDNYLKIKAANITADKDKNGKTISNSKKNKTVKFVQSLNISANQKAVLINLEGYTDYNSQVVSYVDGLHISQSKKNVILRSMGFKVNNDKVTW